MSLEKTKRIISAADQNKRAQWVNEAYSKTIPRRYKSAEQKMMPSSGTGKYTSQIFNDDMVGKSAEFELGPRLKGISLDTDKCVIWPGAMRQGYGVKKMGTTTVNAHRHVYENATGKKIPKGWHIDHKCRERRCINPKHLEPVSPSENKRRAWQSKYLREGNKDKVTDKDVKKAYTLPKHVQNQFASLALQAAKPKSTTKTLKPLSDAAANKLFSDRAAMRRARLGKPKVGI